MILNVVDLSFYILVVTLNDNCLFYSHTCNKGSSI